MNISVPSAPNNHQRRVLRLATGTLVGVFLMGLVLPAAAFGARLTVIDTPSTALLAPGVCPPDDAFEQNDNRATATALTLGMAVNGKACDDDYFKVTASAGQTLVIDLTFLHANGDLDLALQSSSGAAETSSESSDDDERIVFDVTASGTYYVWVYPFAAPADNNSYTLKVSVPACAGDDAFEPNNARLDATALTSGVAVNGNACDDDYFKIAATAGQTLVADLTFTHANGDLDLALQDPDGVVVDESLSHDSPEHIAYIGTVEGTYFVVVYPFQGLADQNSYTLTVTTVSGTAPTIGTIADQITPFNTAEGPVSFTVGDEETPVASLMLTGTSSNTTLVPNANITFGGSGASRTVTVTPAAGESGTAYITITVSDGTQTASATFLQTVSVDPASLGMLRATTSPALPAQISLNGVPADSWGLNWVQLTPGTYTVSFSHVEGYTRPGDQQVTIVAGETTTVTGTFVRRGTLRVMTSPAVPGQISVDGVARDNWGMWTDIAPGTYPVCFGAVADFTPPSCSNVTVVAGQPVTVTGTYTASAGAPGATAVGMLRATTSPALPAQISLNGVPADSWGLNWLELAPGTYTVSFSHVEGYTRPADQQVTIVAGQTIPVTGTFVPRGTLRVMTSPAVPGQISVDGFARDNWGMWTDIAPGIYAVCFGPTVDYTPPAACSEVAVVAGETATVTGTYTPSP